MHTSTFDIDGGDHVYNVHYNGGWDGDIIISPRGREDIEVEMPYRLCEMIVAAKLRSDAIERLEQMSEDDIMALIAKCL